MSLDIANHWYKDLDPGPLTVGFLYDQATAVFDQEQALGSLNLDSGKLKKNHIRLQEDDAFEIVSTPHGLLLATVQDQLCLWRGGMVWLQELGGNDAATICASDTQYAWAAGNDVITVGDLSSGKEQHQLPHHCLVDTITFMNEHALWFRDEENVMSLMVLKPFPGSDLRIGQIIEIDDLPEDATEIVQTDDRFLNVALAEQEWMIWDMAAEEQEYIAWEEQVITCISRAHHQQLGTDIIATGTESGLIRLWNADGEILADIEDHDDSFEIDSIAFSTDGRFLASAAGERELHVIEISA